MPIETEAKNNAFETQNVAKYQPEGGQISNPQLGEYLRISNFNNDYEIIRYVVISLARE